MTTNDTAIHGKTAAEILTALPDTVTPTGPTLPTLGSTVEEIQTFITSRLKRGATDAWDLGEAFRLMKIKKSRAFEKWVKAAIPFSKRTVERYMEVAMSFRRDEVEGLKLTDAYTILHPEDVAKATAKKAAKSAAQQTDPPGARDESVVNTQGDTNTTAPDEKVVPLQERVGGLSDEVLVAAANGAGIVNPEVVSLRAFLSAVLKAVG